MRAELLFALLLLAGTARAAAVPPDAGALLLAALSAPTTGYTARGRIQSFAPGRKPKALGMTVYFLPDGRLRREVRARPSLPPEQVFLDDGSHRELYWPKLGTAWSGTMTHETAGDRAARLRSLYDVSVSTGGRVAKRPTWRLDLRAPGGGLRRVLWVDRTTGLLLKCEEYRLDGTLLRRERLTALAAGTPDSRLFRLEVPPGTAEAPMTAPRGPVPPGSVFPRWIPEGFLALESRAEDSGRTLAVVYGDGVDIFVLRETAGAEPSGREKSGRSLRLKDGSRASLSAGADGPLLEFRSRGRSYSVTGDLIEDEMLRLADSFAAGPP